MVHKDNDKKTDLEIRRVLEQLGLSNKEVIRFFKAIQENDDKEKGHHKTKITDEDEKQE
ncbi:hypothetical protein [Paenibacillus sp. Y412MC10]|uniref:hypothetical protein n=1 Tax=Geobacillus sp. (strain Y412MC10) TaxID=481743 RepID=UPI00164301F9|nr:hypothetical protein [Paenibacillus sp. Y412MC10]